MSFVGRPEDQYNPARRFALSMYLVAVAVIVASQCLAAAMGYVSHPGDGASRVGFAIAASVLLTSAFIGIEMVEHRPKLIRFQALCVLVGSALCVVAAFL